MTINNLYSLKTGYMPLGPGEMACFMSHRLAWKRILSDGVDWAFVAEDDIHLFNAKLFFRTNAWLQSDRYDLVKAETTRQIIELDTELISYPYGHELRILKTFHGGAAGYFVSKRCVGILLTESEHMCGPVDQLIFNYGINKSLRIVQLDPAICIQDYLTHKPTGLSSTLEEDRRMSMQTQGILIMPGKHKGLRKLIKELSRPFVRMYIFINTLFGYQIIKRIRYTGDI